MAPESWAQLRSLESIGIKWLNAEFKAKTDGISVELSMERGFWSKVLDEGLHAWVAACGVDVPWVDFLSLMTVRAFAFHRAFNHEPPSSLLFNVYTFLIFVDGNVELGHATLTERPQSVVVVNADQGLVEWDTIAETRGAFKKRALAAYEAELDAQLDAVEDAVTPTDVEVHWHWIDWTIERYAGRKSIRSIATVAKTSRPGVSKAVEKTRVELGLQKLPENWGATSDT